MASAIPEESQASIAQQIANTTLAISDPSRGVVTPKISVPSNPIPPFVSILAIAGIAYYAAKHYGWLGLVITIGIGVFAIRKLKLIQLG